MMQPDPADGFKDLGRYLAALHTTMVEFGMRRADATEIVSMAVIALLGNAQQRLDDTGKNSETTFRTTVRCRECDGGWLVGEAEIHVASCSKYVEKST